MDGRNFTIAEVKRTSPLTYRIADLNGYLLRTRTAKD